MTTRVGTVISGYTLCRWTKHVMKAPVIRTTMSPLPIKSCLLEQILSPLLVIGNLFNAPLPSSTTVEVSSIQVVENAQEKIPLDHQCEEMQPQISFQV